MRRLLPLIAVVGLVGASACTEETKPSADVLVASSATTRAPEAPSAPVASIAHEASPSPPAKEKLARVDEGPGPYATAKPIGGKSIGHTSVAFKLKLEGGIDAAWKPHSKRGPLRYKGEIAAYRLGIALGLTNVPRAYARSFSKDALLTALGGKDPDAGAGALLEKEAVANEHGEIPGALIPWIPHLDFLALEAEPRLTEWRRWLNGPDDVPTESRKLAAQISTLIVFDYLTGNWDRWSGGNIGFDKEHETLLFIDNDGAFYDVPPPGPLAAQRGRLMAIQRFSKGFVEKLRALDDDSLVKAIGDEGAVPLLSAKALAGVRERRASTLKLIDARIAATSEAAALSFE